MGFERALRSHISFNSYETRFNLSGTTISAKLGDTSFSLTRHGHSHTLLVTNKACDTHSLQFACWVSYIRSFVEASRKLPCNFFVALSANFWLLSRRRQDSQRAVSCFIKDHSISNYKVRLWLRDRKLERRSEPLKEEAEEVRVRKCVNAESKESKDKRRDIDKHRATRTEKVKITEYEIIFKFEINDSCLSKATKQFNGTMMFTTQL